MEFTIQDLPTWNTIHDDIEIELKNPNIYGQNFYSLFIKYINKLENKINNKKKFIYLFLSASINSRDKLTNYYNKFIVFLRNSNINNQINNISYKMLFTNTCQILHYKINKNIYNLYNFVDNNLINDFNIELLNCLLLIYYLYDDEHNYCRIDINSPCEYSKIVSCNFFKLFTFNYNIELPINKELNELKIQINELKLQLSKIENKLIILNKNQNEEYIEVD